MTLRPVVRIRRVTLDGLETNTRRHPEALARPFVGRASKGDGAPRSRTEMQRRKRPILRGPRKRGRLGWRCGLL